MIPIMIFQPKSSSQQLVRKSNELIEARYRLGVWEQRLILTLLTTLSQKDEDFKRYQIAVADFAGMWGLEADKSLYEKVQEAADALVGRTIQISDDPAISETVSWLSYVRYVKGSGVVEMEFHSALKPYLLQLQQHFTQYQISHVVRFRNQYSIRIYELLKMESFKANSGSFTRNFKYKDLRFFLSVDKKEYALFGHFKSRIITPAVKEISTHTDLNIIEVKYGKTGRKITDISFVVKIRPGNGALTLPLKAEESPTEQIHPIVERLINLGFAAETADRYKKRYGISRIERNIAYVQAKQEAGLVKDFPAFLNQAIKEDIGSSWEVAQVKQAEEKAKKEAELSRREEHAAKTHLKKMQALSEKAANPSPIKNKPDTTKTAIMARQLGALLDDHEG